MTSEPRLELRTARLRLVAGSVEMFEAELASIPKLAGMLDVRPPEVWPPALNDKEWTSFEIARMREVDSQPGWWNWYVILPGTEGDELIGDCGFRGRPDERGEVEIAYAILPNYREQGYASEAAGALTQWALAEPGVRAVIAGTFAGMIASQRVLEKIGFHRDGPGSDPGALRYRITDSNESRVAP